MNDNRETPTRLLELLADRALFGLEPDEVVELEALLSRYPHVDAEQFDLLVADLEVTAIARNGESLPHELRHQIARKSQSQLVQEPVRGSTQAVASARRIDASPRPAGGAINWRQSWGWIAAAACLLMAAIGWLRPRDAAIPVLSTDVVQARKQLLASDPTVFIGKWGDPADPSATGEKGDVVWSDANQTGYMRIQGLAKNDAAREQYQLWIFDATQDAATPIDGGVFDVLKDQAEVIVPIAAKLRVSTPTMFAITVEKPGGVVVSKRGRLPLLAYVKRQVL